ncbi:hypothetical protein Pcinc_038478 [Petrolisthes cinctipes]|uniref:Rho guanine nucleotide exchange factor 39 n=1 Tax=Petrolisthes cinctipes TaxID=88211 RepID=A0AAE1EK06_PETCI|nr:hypothetical protein Pcinc_038478 [Petrolisthes cinctipes]
MLKFKAPCARMSETLRSKVLREIVSTEDTYLQQLHTLDKFFVQPSQEKKLFPSHIHTTIFGELATLRHMNQELRNALGSEGQDVGAAFLRLAPFLKAYSSYAKNYQQAINLLLEWEGRSSKVRSWLAGTESRPEVGAKLPALLITPVQRIPRYRLLLGQLLKHTPTDHPHYDNIARAVGEVGEVAEHIDRSVSRAENLQRILMIQRALKHGQPPIVAPGRHLVKEGVLHKVSRNGNNSQPRLFFLFTDVLLYTKLPAVNFSPNPTSRSGIEVLEGEYKPGSLECCCLLPLRHCSILPVLGSGTRGLFRLKCEGEDMLLYSCEDSSGREWVTVLSEAVQQAVDKRKTLRKDSSSRRPLRRPALRKFTIKGDAENILPLKVTKQGDEMLSGEASSSVTPEPPKSKTTFKKHRSPNSLMSQLLQAHDCLTPPRSWLSPGKGQKDKAEQSKSGDGKKLQNSLGAWLSPGRRLKNRNENQGTERKRSRETQGSPDIRQKCDKRPRRPVTFAPGVEHRRQEVNRGRPFSHSSHSPCFKPSPLAR